MLSPLPEPFLQMCLVALTLHLLEVLEEEKCIVKEPSLLDGVSSVQPLTTAIFPPAGSPWSVAQARSPHCLWRGVSDPDWSTLPLALHLPFPTSVSVPL